MNLQNNNIQVNQPTTGLLIKRIATLLMNGTMKLYQIHQHINSKN